MYVERKKEIEIHKQERHRKNRKTRELPSGLTPLCEAALISCCWISAVNQHTGTTWENKLSLYWRRQSKKSRTLDVPARLCCSLSSFGTAIVYNLLYVGFHVEIEETVERPAKGNLSLRTPIVSRTSTFSCWFVY